MGVGWPNYVPKALYFFIFLLLEITHYPSKGCLESQFTSLTYNQYYPPIISQNVPIDQVPIDLCDWNQELEDSDGPYIGLPLLLN